MIGDNVVENMKHHPFLGVELSNNLKWSTHISLLTTKANKMFGLLHCKSTKSIAYKLLIRLKLKCSHFGPHTFSWIGIN